MGTFPLGTKGDVFIGERRTVGPALDKVAVATDNGIDESNDGPPRPGTRGQHPMTWFRKTTFLIVGMALATSASAADWPTFLGPNRDGRSDETGLASEFPKSGPPALWRRSVGAGFSGPVVAGDRLVLFHQVDEKMVVECMNAATGKTVWKKSYPTRFRAGYGSGPGPRATPTIADGHVFTMDPESVLQCLRLGDGELVWRRELAKEYEIPEGFFGVSSSPLVEGDALLVNLGAPAGAGLAALDRKTGKTIWTSTDDTAGYASPVAATIDGRRYAFFFARTGLHAVDPITGKQRFFFRWRARMNASVNAATPLVIGDRVFISSAYNVGATLLKVTPSGQEPLWKLQQVLSNQYNTCVVHDGHLYGIDGRADIGIASLRCVDIETGKPEWSEEGFGCATIVFAEGRLYLLNEQGILTVAPATPDGYRPTARVSILKPTCRAHPALANGRFHARNGRELVALDLSSDR